MDQKRRSLLNTGDREDNMNKQLIPLYALIAILAGILIFLLFRKPPVPVEQQEIKITLNWDSLSHTVSNNITSPPVVVKPGELNIPPAQLTILQSTDTAVLRQVLREVLATLHTINTQTTVSETDSIQIISIDTITNNKLKGKNISYKLKFPITTTTTIINPPNRNKLYLGASIEAGQNGLYGISPEVSFAMKKGTMVGLGYNTYALATGQDKYQFRISLSQKIRLKK